MVLTIIRSDNESENVVIESVQQSNHSDKCRGRNSFIKGKSTYKSVHRKFVETNKTTFN